MNFRVKRKRGSIMVLTIGLLPLFILLIALMLYVGMIGIAKSEVDATADTASHAGAAGGAYAYQDAQGAHVVVEKEPDHGNPGGLNSAQNAWNANQSVFIQGVSGTAAQFNPPGMEHGWSTDKEYYAGHFWVTDEAKFRSVYFPQMIGINQANLRATAKTEVRIKH